MKNPKRRRSIGEGKLEVKICLAHFADTFDGLLLNVEAAVDPDTAMDQFGRLIILTSQFHPGRKSVLRYVETIAGSPAPVALDLDDCGCRDRILWELTGKEACAVVERLAGRKGRPRPLIVDFESLDRVGPRIG